VLLFGCALAAGQSESLGDVARRERERRARAASHPRVLTNEDLQREKILDDDARATLANDSSAAAQKMPSPAGSASAPAVVIAPAMPQPAQAAASEAQAPWSFSLGEYARRLREEKARAREAHALAERSTGPGAATPASRVMIAPRTAPRSLAAISAGPRSARRRTERSPRRVGGAGDEDRVLRAMGTNYTLRRGDSLWKVARLLFRDARLWKEIWRANPQITNPNRVRAGRTVRLPGEQTLARARARLAAPRVARVSGPRNHPAAAASAWGASLKSRRGATPLAAHAAAVAGLPDAAVAAVCDGPASACSAQPPSRK